MSRILLFSLTCSLLAIILCGASQFQRDGLGNLVTDFAPLGTANTPLTKVKTVVDATNYMKYSIFTSPSSGCVVKASAATGYTANNGRRIPASTYQVRAVNKATPFLNFSYCKSGQVEFE